MSALETGYVEITVDSESTMPVYTAAPPGASECPGLLVFMEAFGVNSHIRDVVRRYARRGYVVASPDLYHRNEPGFEGSYTDLDPVMEQRNHVSANTLTADVEASYEWLYSDERTDGSFIGSVGYCMGGKTSFLANTTVPLQASVCYYGGGISNLLDRVGDLQAPILFIWGGQDEHIGSENRRMILDTIQEEGHPHTQITFSEAGHGFACDARDSYHPQATRQALALTREFLTVSR